MQQKETQLSPTHRALLEIRDLRARLEVEQRRFSEPIAIVGMGCRLPGGAESPGQLWDLLRNGVDAITDVPKSRFDAERFYDPNPDAPGRMSTRWGGFLRQVDQFDAEFFGISSREAETLDPQQRLLLEVTWEALEHAGYAPDRLFGSRTGVFVGIGSFDYMQMQLQRSRLDLIDAYLATGGSHSVASGRLSYVLGLQGPSVSIDTACSSSLVTIHLACQSLRLRECDLAVAGGVNVILSPELLINFSRAHMMAADGRCKAFDASADGFVRAEGCGMIVLQRLSDALAQGSRILGLVRGTAVNQDGRSSGLTAPNGPSQQAVIRAAHANAGVAAADVQYVEAHGTGTALGDPIEAYALAAVFGDGRRADDPLLIGSVKTNLGHLEAAAGVAGLIKTLLALQHDEIPPHLHFRTPSPQISWPEMPLRVATARTPWPRRQDRPRLAGVSSFGFSGTNAHIVIEEPPLAERAVSSTPRPRHIVALSARKDQPLRELASRYADRLTGSDDTTAADIAFTANVGRAHLATRLAVSGSTSAEIVEALRAYAEGRVVDVARAGEVTGGVRSDVVFLFTGQGAQYDGMGRELYGTQPVFRAAIDRCAELLVPHLDQPLLSILFPAPGAPSFLAQTAYSQPALFALEYALAEMWKSYGVVPAIVMGHSLGEDVAGCLAGVFGLPDALELMAVRGRMMQALPPNGEMRVVFAAEDVVREAIARSSGSLAIAAVNGPNSVTISGEGDALRQVVDDFARKGIKTRSVTTSHAYHSPLMDPMLGALEQVAGRIAYGEPQLGFVSNVTGELVSAGEISNAEYWRRHVRDTVQFAKGLRTLFDRGYRIFVEIGPSTTLSSLARQSLPAEATCISTLKRGHGDWEHLLETLSELYVRGVSVDWQGFDAPYGRTRVDAPFYPFQRKRFWIEALVADVPNASLPAPTLAAPSAVDEGWIEELRNAYPDERHRRLVECIREEVARVLKVDADELSDPYAGLMDLGLDSLMAVELRTALSARLRLARPLSATLVMDHPSMDAIATHLDSELMTKAAGASPVPQPIAAASAEAVSAEVGATLDASDTHEQDIEALSEEEVEALLLRRLEGMQEPV
jgi:acyl transferase domain-containing protein